MITRKITDEFKKLLKEYPIVTLIGPRQSGKTTLSKTLTGYSYSNLEDPDTREFAQKDPKGFLSQFNETFVILDEIQRVPELLSYIQVDVDKKRVEGKYVLTGSHQLELTEAISQSLAGRTAILKLLPLSMEELLNESAMVPAVEPFNTIALKGFYPGLFERSMRVQNFYSNYYQTYVERDVRQLINLKDVDLFERFMKLLAGRAGQIFSLSGLSNEVGVDSKTIKNWLSVLEASFVITKLPPYYNSLGKRLIKSPKYFFVDTGLLCFLLGIHTETQLSRDPLLGSIFENLVVIEIIKAQLNRGRIPQVYFYRDKSGFEVDMLFQDKGEWTAVEVKSAQTFRMDYTTNLLKLQERVKDPLSHFGIVYSGSNKKLSSGLQVLNFTQASRLVAE